MRRWRPIGPRGRRTGPRRWAVCFPAAPLVAPRQAG